MSMSNKLIVYSYYIFLNSLLILVAAYLFNWMEILELLNKAFFLMGGLILFSVFIISRKIHQLAKISINLVAVFAFITWLLSLTELIDFKTYALLSFQTLICCLLIAIYIKYMTGKKIIFKVLYTISFLFLLITITLLCLGYLSQNVLTFASLSFFSVMTLLTIIMRKKVILH